MAMNARIAIVIAAAASCATPRTLPEEVRFANEPAVWLVNDRRDVAKRPDVSLALDDLDYYDRSFAGPVVRALRLPGKHRARGVNALDEVPDSTWFTNRIGVRDLTPAEVFDGPDTDEGPEPHTPWTVRSTKGGGTELGLVITDARGVAYLVSFDDPQRPEIETGTAVVVDRLLWAAGYNVPAQQVAYVRPSQLVIAPDAVIKDHFGNPTGRLDQKQLADTLAKVWHAPDGRIRVLVSRRIEGTPLGGTPPSGVRDGDPNDRIPHQLRRDLRGMYPILAWLDHIDLIQSNFLDMWIPDPRDPARHYVVHYMVDFGKSLGTMAITDHFLREGYTYSFDWVYVLRDLVTLGFAPRPWDDRSAPALVGVSPTFTAGRFDPGAWRPSLPYAPFDDADRFDKFWGTKILAHFTRAQIHAAVEAGRFTDARTIEYLTDTLVARQHATEAYWYARVNPLDRFRAMGEALCFDDLAIAAQLASPANTRYELASYDWKGRPIGQITMTAPPSGPACSNDVVAATQHDGYTIVRIRTLRPEYAGTTFVHIARDPQGTWRVIGVWRD